MGKKKNAGVQPKWNGRPYRQKTKRPIYMQDVDPITTQRVMAELDYARKYGSVRLHEMRAEGNDDFFYETLYMHGIHVAEYCRLCGERAVLRLKRSEIERLKQDGVELFLMNSSM